MLTPPSFPLCHHETIDFREGWSKSCAVIDLPALDHPIERLFCLRRLFCK